MTAKFEPRKDRKHVCKHCGKANYKHLRFGPRNGECPKHDNDWSYRAG